MWNESGKSENLSSLCEKTINIHNIDQSISKKMHVKVVRIILSPLYKNTEYPTRSCSFFYHILSHVIIKNMKNPYLPQVKIVGKEIFDEFRVQTPCLDIEKNKFYAQKTILHKRNGEELL